MSEDFTCRFCGTTFRLLKTKPSQCPNPACGVVYPKPWPGAKGTDALDRASVRLTPAGALEDAWGEDTGKHPVGLFDVADSAWAELGARAKAAAERCPWEVEISQGKARLIRWWDRTADMMQPGAEVPKVVPVVAEYIGGVPTRRLRALQKVLDQMDPGRRIEDVPVRQSRPGRRHPAKPTEWDTYRATALRARARGMNAMTQEDLATLARLWKRWRNARRCARPGCLKFLPRAARGRYCSPACKQAAKKSRKN